MKMRKYRFNLIEIMLAIVILALGMTSVFVLFPAGLSNHRTAMAENSIADIAELVISRIRAENALSVTEDGFALLNDFPERADLFKSDGSLKDELTSKIKNMLDDTSSAFDPVPGEKGMYVARQISGPANDPYVDFSAVVAVYKAPDFDNELFVPMTWDSQVHFSDVGTSGTTSGAGQIKDLDTAKIILPLVMEISYPAELPYESREKAYFRFEIFNERFELRK